MGELLADLFVSVDGYAAGHEVGPFFGHAGPDLDRWVREETGRPLTEPLGWQNTRLLRGDLATAIRTVKAESEVPVRTIGSLTLVSGLLRLGLVDRLRLMVFPITLGPDGREPAYAAFPRDGMELIESTILDSRLVVLSYRPDNAGLRNRSRSSH